MATMIPSITAIMAFGAIDTCKAERSLHGPWGKVTRHQIVQFDLKAQYGSLGDQYCIEYGIIPI